MTIEERSIQRDKNRDRVDSPDGQYALIETKAYIDELIRDANDPTTTSIRIMSVAMRFGYPTTQPLGEALIQAARKGKDVQLVTSWLSEIGRRIGPLDYWSREDPEEKDHYDFLAEHSIRTHMEKAGVRMEISLPRGNETRFNPLKGNNHRKIALVERGNNKTVFIGKAELGSCFSRRDMMIRLQNNRAGVYVAAIFNGDLNNLSRIYQIEPQTHFLHDQGQSRYSIIQETGQMLAANAQESIILMSQVLPTGNLLRRLADASENGIHVELIGPSPKFSTGPSVAPTIMLANHILARRSHALDIRLLPFPLHAGILVVDGKVAVFGSGNFNGLYTHVSEMTDLSVITENPVLVTMSQRYIDKLLHEAGMLD